MSGYAFTGREWDAEVGLYYYRARYFDPALGRFISSDPSGFVDGPNLFAYVGNKPTTYVDPFGLALTSVDAAMRNAIASGNVAEVKALLSVSRHGLSDAMRTAADIAIKNNSTTAGGLKSAAELSKHLEKLANFGDDAARLADEIAAASTKARRVMQKDLDRLLKDIDGHIKEIWQKWKTMCGK